MEEDEVVVDNSYRTISATSNPAPESPKLSTSNSGRSSLLNSSPDNVGQSSSTSTSNESGSNDGPVQIRNVLLLGWRMGIVLLCLGFLWILTISAISIFGPPIYKLEEYSTYQCQDHSHVWDPNKCNGFQMSQNNTKFEETLPQFDMLNKLWILQVVPYKNTAYEKKDVSDSLRFIVSVLGADDENTPLDKWHKLTKNDSHTNDMECDSSNHLDCEPFILIEEEDINYSWYRVIIALDPSSSGRDKLGDVVFQLFKYQKSYSDMQIALRTIYLLITLGILVAYGMRMRQRHFKWTWHQRATFILLLGLVLLNDPFFPLEFVTRGWFFQFLHAFFEVVFIALLLWYWLVVMDVLRGQNPSMTDPDWRWVYASKMASVCLWATLSTFLLTLIRIRAAKDPVYGERKDIVGETVLFYIISILWSFCIGASFANAIWTFLQVMRSPKRLKEFMYVAVPMTYIILCVIIGMFFGTFGPFIGDGLGFVFFFGLYNCYVWLVTFGNWPRESTKPLHAQMASAESQAGPAVSSSTEEGIPLRTFRPTTSSQRADILALHENL